MLLSDSNIFAMLEISGNIYVSTKFGIYRYRYGGWEHSSLFVNMSPIFNFSKVGDTIFALTQDRLWRKKNTEQTFIEIGHFNDTFARKMSILGSKIIISTNSGIRETSSNILLDNNIDIKESFQSLNRNEIRPCATSLNTINSRLYIGTEERLYSSSISGFTFLHAEYPNTIVPTIFVNNTEWQVGVYWSTSSSNIYFDMEIKPDNSVSIINDYSIYYTENNGWAESNYQATVTLRVNQNVYKSSKYDAPLDQIGQIAIPEFSDRNSNYQKAYASAAILVPYLNGFIERSAQESNFGVTLSADPEAISEVLKEINELKFNLYPELRSQIIIPPITTYFSLISPAASKDIIQTNVTANSVTGVFTFSKQLDKYSNVNIDILSVPISGQGNYSHQQLDDMIEVVNSGLPSLLSKIQQTNIQRLGTYTQNLYGEKIPTFQGSIFTNEDLWYDKNNSTIDYNLLLDLGNVKPLHIPYPNAIAYVHQNAEIWVGGMGGIISISEITRKVTSIDFNIDGIVNVLSLFQKDSTIYVLTNHGIFNVNINDKIPEKDVNTDIPNSTNGLLVLSDSYVISTNDGIYTRRTYDTYWQKIIDIKNAKMITTTISTICFGNDPKSTSDTLVYTSIDGISWSTSTRFSNIDISSVARQSYSIFFASQSGLYVEDIADGSIVFEDIENGSGSKSLLFNDVYADNQRVILGLSDGSFYIYDGNYTKYESGLDTIHKVLLINGKYWIFGRDTIVTENTDNKIRLFTGERFL